MTEHTYYDILGLTPVADGTTVNRTYWLLARKYQAEATTDPRAHHLLDELNEAYTVLGTPVLREAYDATLPTLDVDEAAASEDRVGDHVSATGSPRSSREDATRSRGLALGNAWAYAAAAGLGTLSLGAGIWSGSLALIALGVGAVLATGLVFVRHKIPSIADLGIRSAANEPKRIAVAPTLKQSRPIVAPEPLIPASPRRGAQADELRISTASMVDRWRSAVNATAPSETIQEERGPDSTLVDIFRSEQELKTPSEPLTAVLDVLRGSRG